MVIFNMLEEYEKTGKASVLDQRTLKVGLSYKGHKKVQNIFQVIYIKQISNLIS